MESVTERKAVCGVSASFKVRRRCVTDVSTYALLNTGVDLYSYTEGKKGQRPDSCQISHLFPQPSAPSCHLCLVLIALFLPRPRSECGRTSVKPDCVRTKNLLDGERTITFLALFCSAIMH